MPPTEATESTSTTSNVVDTITLTPHVAASIIEHGKRRIVATGYLLGQKTIDSIEVTDLIPATVSERFSVKDVNARQDTIRPFTSSTVIGWYSVCSTKNPDGTENEAFRSWTNSPGTIFVSEKETESARTAIHLHCELPNCESTTNERPKISWEGSLALVRRNQSQLAVAMIKSLKVSISANGHEATNVVLSHVRNLAFFNGEKPYPSPALLNMDSIAFQHTSKRQSAAEALLNAHKQLKELVDGKIAPASSSGAHADAREVEGLVKEIRQLMDSETAHSTSREDVVTHRLKDALMIKCLASLLKKNVTQIDVLSSQYPDANNNNNNNAGNANSTQRRDQKSSGANFRTNFSTFNQKG